MKLPSRLLAVALLLAPLLASSQLIELSLGGNRSQIHGLNEAGDAIGEATEADGSTKGFLYRNGQMVTLSLGGSTSQAREINEAGDVIGISRTPEGDYHPFFYRGGTITMLSLGGRTNNVSAGGAVKLNEAGMVAGYSYTPALVTHGFFYHNGVMTDIGTLGGATCQPMTMNEAGDIIGVSDTANGLRHGFLRRNGQMVDLGLGEPTTLNNAGEVVGTNIVPLVGGGYLARAYVYRNGQRTELILTGDGQSAAQAINEAGDVIGWSGVHPSDHRPFLFRRDGVMLALTPVGVRGDVVALNEAGDVIGTVEIAGGAQRGFLHRNGQTIDLGTLGGTFCVPVLITDTGDVHGWSTLPGDTTAHAFIYRNGQMTTLGTLGGNESAPWAVNASGEIVGYSTVASGDFHAFLFKSGQMIDLTPAGARSAIAMLITNSGYIGIWSDVAGGNRAFLTRASDWGNVAPTAVDDAYQVDEDQALAAGPSVLANDSDAEGDPIRAELVSGVGSGLLTLNADGTFQYQPATNFNGTDSFTYRAVDSGNLASAPALVTITVRPVNDPPVAVNDAATTERATPVTIAVLANDTDIDGDVLVVTATTAAANGRVTNNPDGTVTYTPAAGFLGNDAFTYTINDGRGGQSTATVNMTVLPRNRPPVARVDRVTVNVPPTGPEWVEIDVLANDTDPDGDAITLVSHGPAQDGEVQMVAGRLYYRPYTPVRRGADTFNYTIVDSRGATDTGRVILLVR